MTLSEELRFFLRFFLFFLPYPAFSCLYLLKIVPVYTRVVREKESENLKRMRTRSKDQTYLEVRMMASVGKMMI